MTSQNIECKNKGSSSSTTAINNNVKVGQSVLMKERNRNQINNNNILLLNRTVIEPKCNVKTSKSVEFTAETSSEFIAKSNLSKLLQSQGETFFDSDVEIIEECDNEKSIEKSKKDDSKNELVKKETPLLQIFDGNVVISQELSLEEVQNLLFQINTKLQNQNNVNSADFPNTTFSTEENSDVEIILEEGKRADTCKTSQVLLGESGLAKRVGKWASQGIESINRKVIVKPLSSGVGKLGKATTQASTSSETNLLISFKSFEGQKTEGNGFEHDYSSGCRVAQTESSAQKQGEPMVEEVILENADTELMQIEVIDGTGGISSSATTISTLNALTDKDGEPIKLPDNLESVPKAEHFPTQRHRWNTNEEIAAILISFDKHNEWQSKEVIIRPKSGSMLLYSRKKVRYRRDGYCWKKRKDGKTTREDHMKLKVQGTECIYGCYVHSAILPTFHRRCYWLLQNPDIVLVHYLNVPYPDDNKLAILAPSLALWGDKKEWTKEELVSQLKPMFYSEEERDLNNELEISTAETVEVIVTQLMEKQRIARAATLTKQLECGCPDSTCADGKSCSHPMRRITAANIKQESNTRIGQPDSNNQVTSTTGSGMLINKSGSNASNTASIHLRTNRNDRTNHGTQAHSSSLVLSLSQIHSGGGLSLSQIHDGTNLLILNNPSANPGTGHPPTPVAMVTNFKCTTGTSGPTQHHQPPLKQYHHPRNKIILKHEPVDANQLSCCRMTGEPVGGQKVTESGGNRVTVGGAPTFVSPVFSAGKSDVEKEINSDPVSPSKRMDTCDNSGDTILILNTSNGNRPNSLSSVVPSSSFYNETLDLSQEDIQRTLSANMPISNFASNGEHPQSKSPSPSNTIVSSDVMVPEINPMELMDSPPTVVDDDVFVNLDAFDMLSDFPELEVLDHSGSNSGGAGNCEDSSGGQIAGRGSIENKAVKDESSSSNVPPDFREASASITDFSPEWAYPEGGIKVLVTGPWYSSTSRYTVLFDSFPVPTTLVQSGVLRCFCPAHEVGLATVQVACEGFVISNSVMFEYKRPPHAEFAKLKEPKLEDNENLLKFTLLQRLEAVDGRLHIKEEPKGSDMSDSVGVYHQSVNFEERMVNYCQAMTNRRWKSWDESSPNWTSGLRGMTLLHLAASLGYTRLVCTLLHWRAENNSLLLETEIDALSQDDEGFTPLMRACGQGHRETALVLYRWNHTALHIHNSLHQTALNHARAKGQIALVKEIEKLEASREEANMTLLSNTSNNLDRLSESDVTPSESPASSTASLNSSKSHDGIFLRPDPVVKSEGRAKTYSTDFGTLPSVRSISPTPCVLDIYNNLSLVKRPSVDSGINLGSCQSDNFPVSRTAVKLKAGLNGEMPKLSRCDRSMSLPSPATCDTYESEGRRMDFALCEVTAAGPSSKSPTSAMENLSEDDGEVSGVHVGEQEVRVLTLAEQIIAAIPDRIKNESEEMQLDDCPPDEGSLAGDALSDSLMEPFLDEPPSTYHPSEFSFEFSDHSYRYYDVATPSSSLSPASSSLQSPSPGFPLDSPSPPPTTQDFCEFFQASGSIFEKDFSNLTLSDREQRELYQAAKIIQKAYRSYKGRKKLAEDKERAAAILIQNYYRRYKQYAYFKQMTRAAMVIQNGYRSYCEHKRFKKSQEAAVCIQNYYRHYKEQGESKRGSRESTPSTGLKRTYSQRRQHQAACKIQQFMRQSKNKLQKERTLAAEKERLDARQSSQDVRRKSPSLDNSAPNNRCAENDGS